MLIGREDRREQSESAGAVLIIDPRRSWPDKFVEHFGRAGWLSVRIDDSKLLPFFVLAGGVSAILVEVSSIGVTEAIALRTCRDLAPQTSVVVVTSEIGPAEVTRALEGGATALIRFDASSPEILRALQSGARTAPIFHSEES